MWIIGVWSQINSCSRHPTGYNRLFDRKEFSVQPPNTLNLVPGNEKADRQK